MLETLFIRLGSQEHDPIQWLIWSNQQREIIASGELDKSSELTHLTEKAASRNVIGFVPGNDVAIKSLKVPGKSSRAITAAAPYMLEDELAQDVESLFFAYSQAAKDKQGNNCFVVAVEKSQLNTWNKWLRDANIKCKTLIPDVLAMPLIDNQWSAVVINQQILLRQSQWEGIVIEEALWPFVSKHWSAKTTTKPSTDKDATSENDIESVTDNSTTKLSVINAYSTLPHTPQALIQNAPEELPLALLAQHVDVKLINLLQGEFQIKEKRTVTSTSWLWVAGIAVCALLVNIGYKGAQLIQLNAQVDSIEENIVTTYKKAFPKTKRVRVATIKSQLTRKLNEVGGVSQQAGFLSMLNQIEPAFKQVIELKPDSMKFDAKRQEMRIQATSVSYQFFDKFKVALEKSDFKVSQGAQNNLGDKVSGSFIITSKGGQ